MFVSHLHGDHFGGIPFLILNGQFAGRTSPLTVVGPPGTARRLPELMECMFPGSWRCGAGSRWTSRNCGRERPSPPRGCGPRASAPTTRAAPGPALALRLTLGATVIGYTGDTAWTDTLIDVAAGADLLIAEAYYRDKAVPYHLSHADLVAHAGRLASRRIVLTHMSADMLDHLDQARFETAADGLVLRV